MHAGAMARPRRSPRPKGSLPGQGTVLGEFHAPLRTHPRCDARRHPRTRRRQICRGLVPRQIRRHACAVHRDHRGTGAAVAAQQRQGLGHRRIRHAAALDPYPHRPRGGARAAKRPHPGNPAPDRPQLARGDRPRRHGRATDQDRLRRASGRRRHTHGGDHRQLCRAPPGAGQAGRPPDCCRRCR